MDVKTEDGSFVYIVNYNYKYIALKVQDKPKNIVFIPIDGLELRCSYYRTISENLELYTIDNYYEIHGNHVEEKLLEEWIEGVRTIKPEESEVKNDTKVSKEEELEEMDLL